MIDRLGQPEGVLAVYPPLGKRAQLRKAPGHLSTADHRLHVRGPKALSEQRPVQDLDVPPERLRRLPIVAQDPQVEFTQEAVGGNLQADVPQGCGNGQRALGGHQSFVNMALIPQTHRQIARELSQPALIAERLGKRFRLAQVVEEPRLLVEGMQRIAQVEAEIDGLLAHGTSVGEMLEGRQGLLKGLGRLPEGRALDAPCPLPVGSRSRPCPTLHHGGHGGPGVRPVRPAGRHHSSRASTMRTCSTRRRSSKRLS